MPDRQNGVMRQER